MENILMFIKDWRSAKFWLLVSTAGLVLLHLRIGWRLGDLDFIGVAVIAWAAIAFLLREKYQSLKIKSEFLAQFLGSSIIAVTLFKLAHLQPIYNLSLSLALCSLALGLIAFGFKGWKPYRQELLIILVLSIPKEPFLNFLSGILSPYTASLSAFILYYLGFNVSLDGIRIALPVGVSIVGHQCSGILTIVYLLKLAAIFLIAFPVGDRFIKTMVPLVAFAFGFIVNGFRIAILATLVADKEAFNYWHHLDGSLLFVLIAVSLLGAFYLWLMLQESYE